MITNFFRTIWQYCKKAVSLSIFILTIVFLVQNRAIIEVKIWPFGIIETRLFILMIFFYSFGLLTATVIKYFRIKKTAKHNKK
jgi:uncharacterized integral membrane protein